MKTKTQISKKGVLFGARKITYGGPYYETLALSAQTGIQNPKLVKTIQ